MSPRRQNWDSPTPSLASKCAPPPRTKEGVPIPTSGEKAYSFLPTLSLKHKELFSVLSAGNLI